MATIVILKVFVLKKKTISSTFLSAKNADSCNKSNGSQEGYQNWRRPISVIAFFKHIIITIIILITTKQAMLLQKMVICESINFFLND